MNYCTTTYQVTKVRMSTGMSWPPPQVGREERRSKRERDIEYDTVERIVRGSRASVRHADHRVNANITTFSPAK